MIILRAINRFTSCTSIKKTLFKKIVTEDEVLALVHLFLLRSCCVCAPLGFVTKHLLDLHHWNELKNFAANNLLSWSLKSRTGIRAIG